MKKIPNSTQPHPNQSLRIKLGFKSGAESGFALIATISVMALVIMIAMAMVSLSSSVVRTSQHGKAMEEAQANARMALMMAVAELQRSTGNDTRVTAPADILESTAPPLTGVWRSWEGTNHDNTGRPIAPDYSVKTSSDSASGHFLTWLVSGTQPNLEPMAAGNKPSDLVLALPTADTIPLLSDGTLGINPGQVHVIPQLVQDENNDTTGSYAWWASPENQKASVMQAYEPRTADASGIAEKWQSHTVPDLEDLGLASLLDNPEDFTYDRSSPSSARRAITLATTEFIADNATSIPQGRFHDLSTKASGLLTNTATGGWRKDLSILSEKWDDIYQVTSKDSEGRAKNLGANVTLPLFRISPTAGDTSAVPKPTIVSKAPSSYTPDQSTLYPWARHSAITPKNWPNSWHAGSASWESLISYATSYKKFTYSSGDGVADGPFEWAPVMKWGWQVNDSKSTAQEFYDYNHKHRMHPIVARFQFIIYAQATLRTAVPLRYDTKLLYTPILTLWNPYNVRLSIDIPGAPAWGVVIGGKRSFPGAFTIKDVNWYPNGPETIPKSQYKMLSNGNFQFMDKNGNYWNRYDNYLQENRDVYAPTSTRVGTLVDMRTWGANIPNGEFSFEPGEVRMFSPDGLAERLFGGTAMGLIKGYKPSAPAGLPINLWGNQSPSRGLYLNLKNEVYTQPFYYRSPGRGFNLSFGTNTGKGYTGKLNTNPGEIYSGVSQEMMSMTALTNGDRAKAYWPEDDFQPHKYTVEEIASVPAMPLYSITIGPRSTIGLGVGTAQSRPTKGFLQTDPLAGMSLVDPAIDDANSHPSNGNFEISYNTLSINSSLMPNISNGEGFMATGFQSGDGLSNLITHELPLRPMASIMELQGWNPRGKNPMPPYQTHLIGNSDATPMIPKDSIVPPTMSPNTLATNLQHDDAYCSNHVLMDDFFLSSISPRPDSFGKVIDKDIETVYSDFLKGDAFLTNRAYRPISQDIGLSDTQVTARVSEIINSTDGDGWQKIASRLKVDGMFNVNSTSVEAWKALLGHAKSMGDIPYHGPNGITTSADNDDRPHPITRGPLGTDIEAGSDGAGENSEITGFRRLTDEQIADLAQKIVDQVRLRGPFLSLSEFVNRQLSENEDLAIAGAVQSAINNLETDPMSDLRDSGNFLSDETMHSKAEANPGGDDDDRLAGVGYEFEKAAEGSSLYGMPGWIRQGDVLRPIAPILSARDDTFTIRAYGDSRDSNGNVIAQAWCEATVSRQRDYVDSTESPDLTDVPTSLTNQTFGRRYRILSFQWITADAV